MTTIFRTDLILCCQEKKIHDHHVFNSTILKVLAWILSFEKVEREKSEERKKKHHERFWYCIVYIYRYSYTDGGQQGVLILTSPEDDSSLFLSSFFVWAVMLLVVVPPPPFHPLFFIPAWPGQQRTSVWLHRPTGHDGNNYSRLMAVTKPLFPLPPTVCACKWGCETRGLECIRTTVSWNRVQLAPPPGGACCFSSSSSFLCCWFLDILNPSAFLVGGERKKTDIERTTTYTYKRTLLWAGNDVNGIALDQSSSLLFYGWYYREEEEARSNKYCGIGNKETLPNRILLLLQPWARTIQKMWLG